MSRSSIHSQLPHSMNTPITGAGRDRTSDPASHAAAICDEESNWVDKESDDDDMDFEESNDQGESEELEYFEATEDDGDAEFQSLLCLAT